MARPCGGNTLRVSLLLRRVHHHTAVYNSVQRTWLLLSNLITLSPKRPCGGRIDSECCCGAVEEMRTHTTFAAGRERRPHCQACEAWE